MGEKREGKKRDWTYRGSEWRESVGQRGAEGDVGRGEDGKRMTQGLKVLIL